MGFKVAEREQVKGQIALIGPSGSGKTVGALKLAYGLCGDWLKIGVADTEHDRSKVYIGTTHTGGEQIKPFQHLRIEPPYTTDKFEKALDEAIAAGLEVLIFDSFSHEWEGVGGITEWANDLGGEFRHWKEPKKAHKRLIDKIMFSPIHVIVTIRTKQEYVIVPGAGKNGKSAVEKLGMKPVQSGDVDYEFLVTYTIDTDNMAAATKDNTGLFKGMEETLTEDHGRKLREWLVEGKAVKSVAEEKQEQDARKHELLEWIKVVRVKSDKAQAWFTNKEIEHGDFPTWSLDSLEKLYAMLNKPKETPQENPKQEESAPKEEAPAEKQEGPDRQKLMDEVNDIKRQVPEAVVLYGDYMGRLKKVEMTELTDKQLTTLHGMALRKMQTAQKEQAKGA